MNKFRRKEIFRIIQVLNNLLKNNKIDFEVFEDIIYEIQTILDEEECCCDNIPENLKSGQRYDESENAIDNLYDAISELEDIDEEYSQEEIIDVISSVIEYLDNSI